jgi:NADH-quinone oxidoreductase subunit C
MVNETICTTVSELYDRSWDSHGMLVLETDVARLLSLITRLKRSFSFDLLLDITGVDYPEREPRFDVVYHLYSPRNNVRVRIKVPVSEGEPNVPTLTGLYGSANYIEREIHEMYGIVSTGNNDLRPILLYEGFVGHPLRKDYPIDMEQPIVAYRK